jgi:hypothetical protein
MYSRLFNLWYFFIIYLFYLYYMHIYIFCIIYIIGIFILFVYMKKIVFFVLFNFLTLLCNSALLQLFVKYLHIIYHILHISCSLGIYNVFSVKFILIHIYDIPIRSVYGWNKYAPIATSFVYFVLIILFLFISY